MFPVSSLVVLLGVAACTLASHKATAQQFSESGVVYEAARNKIGLIRYCRNNKLLDPAIASQAITAVDTGLRQLSSSYSFAKEQGDLAQQAGEDGFWEVSRTRDIASVATLFRTTPADLCQEWADETLRTQAPKRRRSILMGSMMGGIIAPIQSAPQAEPISVESSEPIESFSQAQPISVQLNEPIQPVPQAEPISIRPIKGDRLTLPQAEQASVEPIQADRPPARAAAVERAARSTLLPPLPEKAPILPIEAEFASLRRALPTASRHASTGKPVSGRISGTTASSPAAQSRSWAQAVPVSTRLAPEAAGPLPREQTVAAAAAVSPPPRRSSQPQPLRDKWPFNRLGTPARCWMPGCRWSTPEERRFGRY